MIFKSWFLYSTDICMRDCSHCHFFRGQLFRTYLALTVLETNFVSNKKDNHSEHHDDKNNDRGIHDYGLYRLFQNCVFGCNSSGGQLALPHSACHKCRSKIDAALENLSGYHQRHVNQTLMSLIKIIVPSYFERRQMTRSRCKVMFSKNHAKWSVGL